MKKKIYNLFYLLLGTIVLSSCKDEILNTITDEPAKDITGTWKIVSLSRNGEQLAERIDCSKFRITFHPDGSYTLLDKIAFVVSEPGSYKLNDPQYPSSLLITQQGATANEINFQFPIVEGKRQLSLTFSPGCKGNTYQYNFVRENNTQ